MHDLIAIRIKFDTLNNELAEKYAEASKAREHHQTELNDLYHIIELCDMDAVGMMKAVKKMKEVLKARRVNKERFIILNNVVNNKKNLADEFRESEKRMTRYKKEATTSKERMKI